MNKSLIIYGWVKLLVLTVIALAALELGRSLAKTARDYVDAYILFEVHGMGLPVQPRSDTEQDTFALVSPQHYSTGPMDAGVTYWMGDAP